MSRVFPCKPVRSCHGLFCLPPTHLSVASHYSGDSCLWARRKQDHSEDLSIEMSAPLFIQHYLNYYDTYDFSICSSDAFYSSKN